MWTSLSHMGLRMGMSLVLQFDISSNDIFSLVRVVPMFVIKLYVLILLMFMYM